MITYERLSKRPKAACSLIGMGLSEFEELYAEFEVAHAERLAELQVTKRKGKPRQRATGAGRKHRYTLRDRLLMTLFWLRVYSTYEVMGFFYELNKTNVEDNLKDILATLEVMTKVLKPRGTGRIIFCSGSMSVTMPALRRWARLATKRVFIL